MLQAWLRRNQVGVYAAFVGSAVLVASLRPDAASILGSFVTPVLAVLLYVTFLEVPLVRHRNAASNARFLGAVLGLNFLVVPVVVWALTRFIGDSALVVGASLVLLTPCVDYVIAFTDLAGGDAEQVTAVTPLLLAFQFLLLPIYLRLLVGPGIAAAIDAGPFVEAFVALILLPLSAAWLTEYAAVYTRPACRWRAAMNRLPVPLMGATLFVVIGSQLPRVQASLGRLVVLVPVYVAFLLVMVPLAWATARTLGFDAGAGRALVFASVTRNSLVVLPLALALPAAYELVPAVVVTQTLVELCGMVVLTRVVPEMLPAASDKK